MRVVEAGAATLPVDVKGPLVAAAITSHHPRFLHFLLRDGYEEGLGDDLISQAAEVGDVESMQILHENGWLWRRHTCELAASQGFVDCLQFAHEHGCPWDSKTCSSAARGGHLDCLKYAHEHGCEWTGSVYTCAAAGQHWGCVSYAFINGCPQDNEDADADDEDLILP